MLSKQISTLNKTFNAQPAFNPLPVFSYFELFQPYRTTHPLGRWYLAVAGWSSKIQTFSFVCLTISGLIMPFNRKSVFQCIFLLVSVILFYPEKRGFFHICSKYAKEYEEYVLHAMNMKLPVIVIMIMPHTKNICPLTNEKK